MPRTTARIARLNDEIRTTFRGGLVLVTPTVESAPYRDNIFRAVREYTAFDRDNDPYGEHDFGSLELRGERYFWKIDYYDEHLQFHSPDPADPKVTRRVLTIMHASEY